MNETCNIELEPRKIIGVGLSKTGTTSVSEAMNILGFKSKHFPDEMLSWRGGAVARGAMTLANLFTSRYYSELFFLRKWVYGNWQNDFDLSYLHDYDAFFDLPLNLCFKELDLMFPQSKFILTVRDEESWLKSAEYHFHPSRLTQVSHSRNRLRLDTYGSILFDRESFSSAYRTHIEEVLDFFTERPNDLLVFDLVGGDGWEKLCDFLELERPNVPFPHRNSSRGAS